MPAFTIALIVLVLSAFGGWIGRRQVLSKADGDSRRLHSRPIYYTFNAALFTAVPALLLLCVWMLMQPVVLAQIYLPSDTGLDDRSAKLVVQDIRTNGGVLSDALAAGVISKAELADPQALPADLAGRITAAGYRLSGSTEAAQMASAASYRATDAAWRMGMTVGVLLAALSGLIYAIRSGTPQFRARNSVESFVKAGLIACSCIAIFTTLGIVLSMLFESGQFFRQYSWVEFFFRTVWSPRFGGGSQLGILPLIWGTLYISLIALIVAVPIGLFSAVYMSEYASGRTRAFVKPVIEVLAGIPTIVYGLFALITIGPMLRDYFAQPLGLGTSGSSVMTAGLVMGIMLIPFVSSLSDDIINSVPQSLRDGALGLGSTQSETIRKVVLPAALPGIVGAVLLAASRAIGETMIVVMGAGAAAQMGLNPFEAMTTITVKIVSQLTGDTDFAAPETLVAFALGLSLFVITLGLNVVALIVVRKYREQYE